MAYHSEVATGGIVRFTLTRLCYSQILSIQDLYHMPFSELTMWSPVFRPAERDVSSELILRSLHTVVWTFLTVPFGTA